MLLSSELVETFVALWLVFIRWRFYLENLFRYGIEPIQYVTYRKSSHKGQSKKQVSTVVRHFDFRRLRECLKSDKA